MAYTVTKKIIAKKKRSGRRLLSILIAIAAIPVIIIALVSLALYFCYLWLYSKISSRHVPAAEHYRFETSLVQSPAISITAIEDEADQELACCNEAWKEHVYDEETCLYRVRTTPVLPELEDTICCFYAKELPDGVFLQLLIDPKTPLAEPATKLLFLDYRTFSIKTIDRLGPFYLYNDADDAFLIRGFNRKESVELRISGTDM